MHHKHHWLLATLVAASVVGLAAQAGPDGDASWNAFITWFKTAPISGNPLAGYADKLKAEGKGEADVRQELARLMKLADQRADWIEIYFDKVFTRPLTGVPEEDGFDTSPNALLVEAIKGLKAGTALDAGMGQGRNAVYLARQGWTVTGFDISGEAVAAAEKNAANAGVRLKTARAGYDRFDFGTDRWDLIVLAYAWAPVADPAFVARLHAALRPGGRVVFEHIIHAGPLPGPNLTRTLKPGELRACFGQFQIASYEEVEGIGEWGGPGRTLVRMVAVKQ
jgi:2-polyprenyl-3-methyl-5-hydroxy-6-metoxy-1,4-benzoquinol methylase